MGSFSPRLSSASHSFWGITLVSRTYGPQIAACDAIHAEKYRGIGESFRESQTRVASALSDNDAHFSAFREILLEQRFLPGGRIQGTIGSPRNTTPYNCFVSGIIADSFTHGAGSIMARAAEAADTMRLGGGIGYDFSTLRPSGDVIRKLRSNSSGPVSFMGIFNEVGLATASSGHRRGAQMGVLRVDHPDIEIFVRAKQNNTKLLGFNISVGITDEFMQAVANGDEFDLKFGKRIYKTIDARALWEMLMRSTYDWSEPGVLFLDTINNFNNLWYCETITATNPCGEQPLPPYGACLLGSFNLVQYLERDGLADWSINYQKLFSDIPHVVRAMDNVVDVATYPLSEQEDEAMSKRRMGLGVTGVANCIEALGHPYGSPTFCHTFDTLLARIKNVCYRASALLAREKKPFPLFDKDLYLEGRFIATLDNEVLDLISQHGIRNSHLLSIAPTGTISLSADNISSGIEPVFAHKVSRLVNASAGMQTVELDDYGVRSLGVRGRTADECSAEEHVNVLITAAKHMDSAVTKTCNVRNNYPWEDFKNIYWRCWKNQVKGCTTHRTGNLRGAILHAVEEKEESGASGACILDEAGNRTCE